MTDNSKIAVLVTKETYERYLEAMVRSENCECEPKRIKMTRNPQKDGRVLIAHCEVDNKFCPECGIAIEVGS